MEVYKLYYRPMFHVSLRILGDRMEAEDVMQESFLVAFRNMAAGGLTVSFGGWMKRIVINRSLDALRKRRYAVELTDEYPEAINEETVGLPEEGPASETVEKIRRALMKLPEKYRLVLSLNLFEGYDHDEISQILGVTASTSRAQLSRGKQKLVELITQKNSN
jgi:RNA polymerase sigma-70 factor (ECF subfamily)